MNNQRLIKTSSCYVALYDQSSPANRRGFMADEWNASNQAAEHAGQESLYSLFHFNEHLTNCVAQGQMLAWTLLFDGVFSVEVQVDPRPLTAPAKKPQLTEVLPSSAVLRCPTGRMLVSCLSETGQPIPVAIEIEPGEYQATLIRNDAAEHDHALLESLADHTENGGPDWSILLQRVEAS